MISQIARWILNSHMTVAFTGAGISTESGIPDFRSPGGVWSKYRTIYFQEFIADREARYEYWRQKSEGHRDFSEAKPNVGHKFLADMEASDRLHSVITQNIDGLHQIAGNRRVLELHGTARPRPADSSIGNGRCLVQRIRFTEHTRFVTGCDSRC